MNKEFIFTSQMIGLCVFLSYSHLPLLSQFWIVALILVWRFCGRRYDILLAGFWWLLTLPIEFQNYSGLVTFTANFIKGTMNLTNNIAANPQAFITANPTLATGLTIFGQYSFVMPFAIIPLVGLDIFLFYKFYKRISNVVNGVIQRVHWEKSYARRQ